MIRIFIGYDRNVSVAYNVLQSSIIQRSSQPVSITPICLSHIKSIFDRPLDPLQSTEFSFSRFLVPYLSNYDGWSIFMDNDMLLLDDIAKLWDLRDSRYSVQVVKHKHEAEEGLKFLNKVQTSYKMKNWTSVMIFNNEKCRSLTLDYVNRASGLELHQFHWLKNPEAEIGDIPSEWNYLVGVNPKTGKPKNVHFTLGGPFFNEFRDIEFSSEWFQARECMNSCSQKSESYDRNNKNSGAELNV